MYHFFVEPPQILEKEILINGADVNHIKNVLRMAPGEEISISSGQDAREYICRITSLSGREIRAEIVRVCVSDRELPCKIILFQGLPKGDKMELIIQKAVELGVSGIVPVATSRCVVKLDAKREQSRRKRWESIAKNAAMQSGRLVVPYIAPMAAYGEALHYAEKLDVKIIPYELAQGMERTREIMGSLKEGQSVGVFIGPEGGFEEKEIAQAKEIGAEPVTLGRRILRTETAGLATLSMLAYNLER